MIPISSVPKDAQISPDERKYERQPVKPRKGQVKNVHCFLKVLLKAQLEEAQNRQDERLNSALAKHSYSSVHMSTDY